MASNGKRLTISFEEFLNKQMNMISKESIEYERVLESTQAQFSPQTTEKRHLHETLIRLKAEKHVLELMSRKQPEFPTDPQFLYKWAEKKLIEEKEEDELTLEELSLEKAQLIEAQKVLLEKKEQQPVDEESHIKELIESEEDKSTILEGLQRKIIKRMRRLARFHIQSEAELENNLNCTKSQKSFYKVLKEFIVELQDRSKSTNQQDDGVVVVDETFPSEHIQFLEECGVIEWLTKPHTMRLVPMEKFIPDPS